MSTVGGGYVWPNITIWSDGERLVFHAQPTTPRDLEPLRYIAQATELVRATEFETAVDDFVEQVRGRLNAEGVLETNLDTIWKEVLQERADPAMARWRRLEALLGHDVDEAEAPLIERLIHDIKELGESAVQELAAARSENEIPMSSNDIRAMADNVGLAANPKDAIRLADKSWQSLPTGVVAWKRGVSAARALREQERLDGKPITNNLLCEMAAVTQDAVTSDRRSTDLSFALDRRTNDGSVVLRSKMESGRRFNLARLIGDRVAVAQAGRLRPATSAYTYRQKLQRAFAAEFLCPFEGLEEYLKGDYSSESIEEAAICYNVSEVVVIRQLENHGIIDHGSGMTEVDAETSSAVERLL